VPALGARRGSQLTLGEQPKRERAVWVLRVGRQISASRPGERRPRLTCQCACVCVSVCVCVRALGAVLASERASEHMQLFSAATDWPRQPESDAPASKWSSSSSSGAGLAGSSAVHHLCVRAQVRAPPLASERPFLFAHLASSAPTPKLVRGPIQATPTSASLN